MITQLGSIPSTYFFSDMRTLLQFQTGTCQSINSEFVEKEVNICPVANYTKFNQYRSHDLSCTFC